MIIKISWREYPSSTIPCGGYDEITQNKCIDHISTLRGFKSHWQYHTSKEYLDGFRVVNMFFEFEPTASLVYLNREIKRELNVQVI